MTERRIFWLFVFASLALLLYILGTTITPFALCFILAYILDPLVGVFQRAGLGRTLATCIVCFVAVFLFLAMFGFLVPFILSQAVALARALPDVLNWLLGAIDTFLRTPSTALEWVMSLFDIDSPAEIQQNLTGEISAVIKNFGKTLFQDTRAILTAFVKHIGSVSNSLSFLVLVPFILFYLLRDWQNMIENIVDVFPRSKVASVRVLAYRCNQALGGFFRGQLLVAVFLGLFYGIGLQLIGLPFGFLIGFFTGLLSFIPYVGMVLGFVIAEILAIVHFGSWQEPLLVAAVFVSGQAIESSYLTPKYIGESIQLHPVWIIFGLFAGGSLFGFTGLLFAIPILAVLGVLVRFMLEQYQDSAFYRDR